MEHCKILFNHCGVYRTNTSAAVAAFAFSASDLIYTFLNKQKCLACRCKMHAAIG